MTTILIVILFVLWLLFMAALWGVCRAAGQADELAARIRRNMDGQP